MAFMEAVLGQERARKALERFVTADRIPPALVFIGPSGVGKALAAREFAKALLCPKRGCGECPSCLSVGKNLHPDVKFVDSRYQASLRGEEASKQKTLRVETIRTVRQEMELAPLLGGWKVAVVDEAHSLETESANALLKIVEEPPPRTIWVLTTCQRERVPRTILSRCFPVMFQPLPHGIVRRILLGLPDLEPARVEALVGLSDGSIRMALELAAALDSDRAMETDPLAPFRIADSLPRELSGARGAVEKTLRGLAQRLRVRHLEGHVPFNRVEEALRDLARLRRALDANADPRAILALAGEAARGAAGGRP